jgi:hypothetical protein
MLYLPDILSTKYFVLRISESLKFAVLVRIRDYTPEAKLVRVLPGTIGNGNGCFSVAV